jgi:two-component system, sensor histidine kinase and response regulator
MQTPFILNVDDYVPGRYARTKVLKQVGLPIREAGTGTEAIEILEQQLPALVLLDVNLPDMSGFEVCRRIRSNPDTAATTVLHISASSILPKHKVHGLDSGADGYLVEPIEPEVLVATVKAHLRARAAEEALRRSTEELRWFSYRVAHDLHEPLRTISLHSQLLKRRLGAELRSEDAAGIDFISGAARRMIAFVDGLLQYSETAGAEKAIAPFDCEAALARVESNCDAAVRDTGAKITHDPLPVFCADAALEQVFQNLVSNAIKYRREGVPPEIHVSARKEGGMWVFSVADNGIGIDPEYVTRIFKIFHRLHGQEVPGSGIGLALARKIVESHGGKIWVESRPQAGSTFYFSIPVEPAVAPGLVS